MKKLDLLCFGEPLYEFSQKATGDYQAGHGGDVSNCAIAAARCGANVGMLAHLGADSFGDSFVRLWQDEGINTDEVRTVSLSETGVYFITHDQDGHHFSYRRKGSAASQITPQDISANTISRASLLHVSGISQAISESASSAVKTAIKHANETNTLVSYDTNLRLQLWSLEQARETIHQTIEGCHILLPGLDDARLLCNQNSPDDIVDFYLNLGCEIIALTMGEQGLLVATKSRREAIPSYSVNAIDATAAGDIFDGAFLANYSSSKDPFLAARFANATAALSTTRLGAAGSVPTRIEIEKLMEESAGD